MENKTKKDLVEDVLKDLCNQGLSDAQIGAMYGMTGEGVAYRRKKCGIKTGGGKKQKQEVIEKFNNTPKNVLENDYYNLTKEQFSKKYSLSKFYWLPRLRALGIVGKQEKRISLYPPFTSEQKRLLIGSLLGDGGITPELKFYESHSNKQSGYLSYKHKILQPYSLDIRPCDNNTGRGFRTVSHPNFKEFREVFYTPGIKGKNIPFDFIKKEWGDDIIAYWFFDDGSYDDVSNTLYIANKCPIKQDLLRLVGFINEKYGWHASVNEKNEIYSIDFKSEDVESLVRILIKYATPDLYYKIPERYMSKDLINNIDISEGCVIKPKLYRIADEDLRKKIVTKVFSYYRKKGFPYLVLSEKEKLNLLSLFSNAEFKNEGDTIIRSTSGIRLCESFFPNMYNCGRSGYRSPVQMWDEDRYLNGLILNRMKYAKHISNATMRTGIKLSRNCVSNFKPSIAKYLYDKYCKNKRVLDYSSGFGSRMLAAMVSGCEYTAYEPNTDTFRNLIEFGAFLEKYTQGKANVYCKPFESDYVKKEYFGIAFSSPPYFDFEWYSDEDTQSITKYPSREEWLNNYWRATVKKSCESLVSDGVFAACLSPYLCKDLIEVMFDECSKQGFKLLVEYKTPFKNIIEGNSKFEIVFVFSRNGTKNSSSFTESFKVIPKETLKKFSATFPEMVQNKRFRGLTSEENKKAKELFIEKHKEIGLSRESYTDPSILGVPYYVLEHKFKGWNNFIRECGIEPQYEAKTPLDRVKEYFEACDKYNKSLSFYEYEQYTSNPSTRLKRLFNKGKKFHHLKEELFRAALNKDLRESFICRIKDIDS